MKGKLNVGRFLDRMLRDDKPVMLVSSIIKSTEDEEFDMDKIERFYSPIEKDMCYNFNGFSVYGKEIDIV